jgi:hypothetical protein
MTDAAQITDRYIAVWNETDPARHPGGVELNQDIVRFVRSLEE